jgi:hypothetical protein
MEKEVADTFLRCSNGREGIDARPRDVGGTFAWLARGGGRMESLTRKAGMEKQNVLEPDALRLLAALARLPDAPFPDRVMPGEVATSLGLGPAKAWRLFRELFIFGYYEYDISAYNGRLTEAGQCAAKDLIS